MIRILIIWIGSFAVYHTDLQSDDVIKSTLFPIINGFYLIFLFQNFVGFLFALRSNGTKGYELNLADLFYDVYSLLYEEISSRYSGRFDRFGNASGVIEDVAVLLEIVCVLFSVYLELKLLLYLAW